MSLFADFVVNLRKRVIKDDVVVDKVTSIGKTHFNILIFNERAKRANDPRGGTPEGGEN